MQPRSSPVEHATCHVSVILCMASPCYCLCTLHYAVQLMVACCLLAVHAASAMHGSRRCLYCLACLPCMPFKQLWHGTVALHLANFHCSYDRQTEGITLSWVNQHSTVQHSTAQDSTAQHSTAQHRTAQSSAAQHNMAQHSMAQHSLLQHAVLLSSSMGCMLHLCRAWAAWYTT